jgi:hypothetical protein
VLQPATATASTPPKTKPNRMIDVLLAFIQCSFRISFILSVRRCAFGFIRGRANFFRQKE